MTIDERLDRLTARHEALTQTVEILVANQLRADERMTQLDEHRAYLDDRMAQLMDTMNRLANIVISHEERLDRLEGN